MNIAEVMNVRTLTPVMFVWNVDPRKVFQKYHARIAVKEEKE